MSILSAAILYNTTASAAAAAAVALVAAVIVAVVVLCELDSPTPKNSARNSNLVQCINGLFFRCRLCGRAVVPFGHSSLHRFVHQSPTAVYAMRSFCGSI